MYREELHDEEVNFLELFYRLKKVLPVILLVSVVTAAVFGFCCRCLQTPIYASTAKICILSQDKTILSLADLQIGSSLTNDYIELMQSRVIADQVMNNLEIEYIYQDFLECLTIRNPEDTRILCITVEDEDPVRAKQIVDEYANVSVHSIAENMAVQEPNIIEYGYVEEKPIRPNMIENMVVGGLLGVLFTSAVIVIRFLADDQIHSTEQIEKYIHLNTLASVPNKVVKGGKHREAHKTRTTGRIGLRKRRGI